MTTARNLFLFVFCCMLADACSNGQASSTTTADAGFIVETGNANRAGLTDLCNRRGRSYVLPTLGLPLASSIPGYVPGANNDAVLIPYLQNKADELSWATFIAMNWLANENGTPDSTQCFGSRDGITVWEHWMPGRELFRADNRPPRPWQQGLAKQGHPKNSDEAPVLKTFKLNELSEFDADRQIVPNQHGFSTLYEVFYSRQVYDYVVGGGLNTIAGQRQFVKKWPREPNGLYLIDTKKGSDTLSLEQMRGRAYLPVGVPKDTSFAYPVGSTTSQLQYYKNIGAIMVKSAWTVLTSDEDIAEYHTRTVRLNGKRVKLGLVGLHIAHKLAEAPRWMWSTFEHVKNTPRVDNQGVAVLKPGVDYLYFDEKRNDTSTYNKPPQPNTGRTGRQAKVQIVRVQKRAESTDQINDQFHALLSKANKQSVWLNYRLVGTQWPSNNPDPLMVGGPTQPALLANAILETYHQKTSTCMGCHSNARFLQNTSANEHGHFADFVWGMALGTKPKK